MMVRRGFYMLQRIVLFACLVALTGCVSMSQPCSNPLFVRANNSDDVWERTVDVMHAYQFPIDRENKLDGTIESKYKTGSGILEPWHADSATAEDRWESSLQTIRRRASFTILPAEGGYFVTCEVQKEIEDPQNLLFNSPGYATFRETTPLQRQLDVVVGPTTPEGWLPQGRDPNLEASMLAALRHALTHP